MNAHKKKEEKKSIVCYETRVNGTFRNARPSWYFRDRKIICRHFYYCTVYSVFAKKNRRVIKENAQSGNQRSESKMKSLVAVVGGENDPAVMFAKTTVAISSPSRRRENHGNQ